MRSVPGHGPLAFRISIGIDHAQFGGDVDTALETARHGTELGVEPVYPFSRLPLIGSHFQSVGGVNSLDDQYIAVLFDLSFHVGCQAAVARRYLARLQRAPEGAGQSAACGCIDIVERGGMRLVDVGVHAVMFGHLGMDAELRVPLLSR